MPVHLNIRSEYSLDTSIIKIPQLVTRCRDKGLLGLALTDKNSISGSIKFYKQCVQNNIKPILGCDINIKSNNQIYSLTLLAKNNEGYKEISYLLNQQFYCNTDYIEKEWLSGMKNIIILSGGIYGELGQAIVNFRDDELILKSYQSISNEFFISLHRLGIEKEYLYINRCMELAKKHQVPVAVVNNVLFLDREDFSDHEIKAAVLEGITYKERIINTNVCEQQYLKSQSEMAQLFSDIPSAIKNTLHIAKSCNVTWNLPNSVHFPIYDYPGPKKRILWNLCEKQAQKYNISLESNSIYGIRLKKEIITIEELGYSHYFLIMADIVQWAKKQGVMIGPGRGSAAGSLLSYLLCITTIDPIKHDLLFERFLNKERKTIPDIDIDFCPEQREKVIEYVINKYGADHVAAIATFNTMGAKSVLRDVGRALEINIFYVNKITKTIPETPNIKLASLLEEGSEAIFATHYNDPNIDPITKQWFDTAIRLEGLARSRSKHAAGIVISPEPLWHHCAVFKDEHSNNSVTQIDKDDIETIGLIKFDFLGLKTLSVIGLAVKNIHEKNPKFSLDKIPMDNEETFLLLQHGHGNGVFQIDSPGIIRLMMQIRPINISDICALIALYRPGPLLSGMVKQFIINRDKVKKGEPLDVAHPKLEIILKDTYGIIIYQEQIMAIAQQMAGFSLGQGDILLKAIGKKNLDLMHNFKDKFIQGGLSNNIDAATMEKLFGIIEEFAKYGFNKAHATSYADITYRTAYLKANYTAEYMSALLSFEMNDHTKLIKHLVSISRLGLVMLPPCIKKSYWNFTVVDEKTIRFGLGAIKGLGNWSNQQFHCIEDVFKISKRQFLPLLHSGALDIFGFRETILKMFQEQLGYQHKPNSLFIEHKEVSDTRNWIMKQREAIGMVFGTSLLDLDQPYLNLLGPTDFTSMHQGGYFAGTVENIFVSLFKSQEIDVVLSNNNARIKCKIDKSLWDSNFQEGTNVLFYTQQAPRYHRTSFTYFNQPSACFGIQDFINNYTFQITIELFPNLENRLEQILNQAQDNKSNNIVIKIRYKESVKPDYLIESKVNVIILIDLLLFYGFIFSLKHSHEIVFTT